MPLMLWMFAVALGQSAGAGPEVELPAIQQTMNQREVQRCSRSGQTADASLRLYGATVLLECVVGADGSPERCEVLNPTPAAQRHESVFQCMASHLRWIHADGTSAEGRTVRTTLRVQGTW
jgi:hypothetical protein